MQGTITVLAEREIDLNQKLKVLTATFIERETRWFTGEKTLFAKV